MRQYAKLELYWQYTPITYEREAPAHLPKNYGSYHQLYRLDGELIAMAVLDILPSCVSSVYFMYNNNWERFSLGKVTALLANDILKITDYIIQQLSALREAALAREIHEYGAKDMRYLYMGNCRPLHMVSWSLSFEQGIISTRVRR